MDNVTHVKRRAAVGTLKHHIARSSRELGAHHVLYTGTVHEGVKSNVPADRAHVAPRGKFSTNEELPFSERRPVVHSFWPNAAPVTRAPRRAQDCLSTVSCFHQIRVKPVNQLCRARAQAHRRADQPLFETAGQCLCTVLSPRLFRHTRGARPPPSAHPSGRRSHPTHASPFLARLSFPPSLDPALGGIFAGVPFTMGQSPLRRPGVEEGETVDRRSVGRTSAGRGQGPSSTDQPPRR